MTEQIEVYFEGLEKNVKKEWKVAEAARAKGLDPVDKVETSLAMSLAEKSIELVATMYPQVRDKKIVDRILELEEAYGKSDLAVSFQIAEEIAKEKYCKFESLLQAIEAGIRVGFAYSTLGVVASPLEGFTELKLNKTRDGKDYFVAYFSGPIRSAGTTATTTALMLIDYLREMFGFAKYDPSEDEVKRYVTENYDFHERVSNLQYLPTEEEIVYLARNMPIEISGEASERKEVSNYKDLSRISTNFIRGGMCLCFSEGLAQKAQKGMRMLRLLKEKGFKSTGWDFLDKYIDMHKKREKGGAEVVATYIQDLVAGRPVYGHPSWSGGFRFRYGRSRISGFSSTSIHPATMGISNDFLSSGTQLKIEKPSKGCIVTSCDSIDGPIVKLRDGSVRKVETYEEAKKLYKDVEEIIYLGDMLFPLGDVINRNYELLKPGYVEEWWGLELAEAIEEKFNKQNGVPTQPPNSQFALEDRNEGVVKSKSFTLCEKEAVDLFNVSFEQALEFSEKYKIPFHPKYICYWTQISIEDFMWLLDWLQNAEWREKLVLPYAKSVREKFAEGKRALELLGVEHEVVFDNVVVKDGREFLFNLGLKPESLFKEIVQKIILESKNKESVLEIVNDLCEFEIKDKAGTFIGSRMGRPEKAKLRKLTGSPSALFPIGEQGGRFRSVNAAVDVGFIKGDFPIYFCSKCGKETIYKICEDCGVEAEKRYYCWECGGVIDKPKCDKHERVRKHYSRKIDSKHYFEKAIEHLGLQRHEIPELIKGVRGTSSEDHDFENLAKGILRSKHGLCVNKDGTVRYDATEVSITQFKALEIGVGIEKLKKMGYEKDIYGGSLEREDQILDLMPQDIILPCCPDSDDEKADDVFLRITQFIDEELERFYKLPRFYNLKSKEDLVGQLVVCMAPHNCAGVIGRIIGFSKVQGLTASPYIHAAVRRDCDGDEAAIMLLMDVLLNFSRKFLPDHRGGRQDAPLVLNARIQAGEVDKEVLDFETVFNYPLEVYRLAEQGKHSSETEKLLETIKARVRGGTDPFTQIGFTHDTADFNAGVVNSAYKSLPTMQEKVANQMELVSKIRAVDTSDVARLIIERHFIRDIRGNLRKFAQQQFRCVTCNEKFRRPPLSGICTKCGGKIIFTIHEGSIIKYLEPAISLANNFNIKPYTKQALELAKDYIESIFGKELDKQIELKQWF